MITIYWGVDTQYSPEGLRAEAPISILQKLINERIPEDMERKAKYNQCPAFVDELKNIYGIKSYHDYTIQFKKNGDIFSPDYNDMFLHKHLKVKSLKGNVFEFLQNFAFFTEEPSLKMSLLPAYLEDNNIVNSTIMVPGKIDIGKYFRGLQFAFHMKQNCNEIIFNRKEIYFYVKFNTEKKIQFKQFFWTPEINQMDSQMMSAKNAKYDIMNLDYYYNIFDKFNFKKKILKIIKQNLCKEEKNDRR